MQLIIDCGVGVKLFIEITIVYRDNFALKKKTTTTVEIYQILH